MATFRQHFVSRQPAFYTFGAIILVVQIWAAYNVLKQIPVWLMRLSTWDLIGVFSYTQAFALFESAIVLFVLVIVAALLPAHLYRDIFAAVSVVLVLVVSIWTILLHLNGEVFDTWGFRQALPWIFLFLATTISSYLLVLRSARLQGWISQALERVIVLASVYIFLDIICLGIVIIRNIGSGW